LQFVLFFKDQTSAANEVDIEIVFESPLTLNASEMAMFEYHMVKVEQFFQKHKLQTPEKF
jgi:hypothetical protein